jgi:hypothetical protein
VAWIFVPLSHLSPNISLLIWQLVSIMALILSSFFLSRTSQLKTSDVVFLSALFSPIMINLWAGQVSLVIGLLPLSSGYFLLRKGRPFSAGLVWSFLALKPQYFPVAALVVLAHAFARRFESLAGLTIGTIGLTTANLALVPIAINDNWLNSLKLSDTIFSSGLYKIPFHLIISLPSTLMMSLPIQWRTLLKLPIYSAAAFLWSGALWQSRKVAVSKLDDVSKVSLILLIALLVLPLTSPHLLYYDLCIFLPAGVILLGNKPPPPQSVTLKYLALIGWLSISVYMLVFMNVAPHVDLPLVLELILLVLFAVLLTCIDKICAPKSNTLLT